MVGPAKFSPSPPQTTSPDALFLGTDGARDDLFHALLADVVEDHLRWRRGPQGHPGGPRSRARPSAQVRASLAELKGRLRASAPFHSPYYIAHMASDVLVPGLVGYVAGLLYNQNNIAAEKSPSTTPLELEVAAELASLVGFDPKRAWGHLTSGGTVANFEGLWAARNLKAFPFAARELATRKGFAFRVRLPDGSAEDIRRLSPVELLNLPVPEVLRMRGRLEERAGRRAVSETLAAIGPAGEGLASLGDSGVTSIGRILLPGTKHYSWLKIAEALGVGRASLRFVALDEKMRMKPRALEARVRECRDGGEAVLAAVTVVGSTAEGAVDPVDEVIRVQARESRKGTPFYIHADAAYGGYVRALLRDTRGRLAKVKRRAGTAEAFPSPEVARALTALPGCDSVTVDPHKFGYVPVPAGAILFRDGVVRGVLATPRPYFSRGVEDWRENPPSSIGGFILEGTKPGAAAAACWLAHACVPLNRTGYGHLVARARAGADELAAAVRSTDGRALPSGRGRVKLRVKILCEPDLNILCFAANPASNRRLARMNAFNRAVFRHFAIEEVGSEGGRFILSSATFTREEYGDAPAAFLRRLGIAREEWARVGQAFLMRAVVLSPAFAGEGHAARFQGELVGALGEALP